MKEAFIFLHLSKSGGSSFWSSLTQSAVKSNQIYIGDTHYHSCKNYGTAEYQKESAKEIFNSFQRSEKSILLLHRHGGWGKSDILIPDNIERTYILLIRNAEKRLLSAFKWYLITELKKSNLDSEEECLRFFNVSFGRFGYNDVIPRIFKDRYQFPLLGSLPKEILFPITLNGFNQGKKSAQLRLLSSKLNIEIPKPFTFKNTVTKNQALKATFPSRNFKGFWNELYSKINDESSYNSDILSRFS